MIERVEKMEKKVNHKNVKISSSKNINKSTTSIYKNQKERKTEYLPDEWLLEDESEQPKSKRKKKNKF